MQPLAMTRRINLGWKRAITIYGGDLYFVSAIFDWWTDIYGLEKLGMFASLEQEKRDV